MTTVQNVQCKARWFYCLPVEESLDTQYYPQSEFWGDFGGTLVSSCVLSHPVWLFAAPVMGLIIWFCLFAV